jgi:corrinoid adenosyltransferase
MIQSHKLSSKEIEAAVAACKRKASEIGMPMDIAVTDDGGNLLHFERMDGAIVGGISLAIDKAYTSAIFGMRTEELGRTAVPGGPDFGISSSDRGRIIIFGGGVPIIIENNILGAVGCSSGGTSEQDSAVASAGVDAVKKNL